MPSPDFAQHTAFPQAVFPEPAPYVYYIVTAVRPGSFDLISDDGEPWQGIPADRQDLAKIEVGGRFTWDGSSLENYVPYSLQPDIRGQVRELNSLPAHKRIQMRHQSTVQSMREFGYVFDSQSRLMPVRPDSPYL